MGARAEGEGDVLNACCFRRIARVQICTCTGESITLGSIRY